jgi:hypothetical protein
MSKWTPIEGEPATCHGGQVTVRAIGMIGSTLRIVCQCDSGELLIVNPSDVHEPRLSAEDVVRVAMRTYLAESLKWNVSNEPDQDSANAIVAALKDAGYMS